MAVTITNLTADTSSTSATSYTTASITPVANEIVLVAVFNKVGSGTATVVSVSGCNLTWHEVIAVNTGTDPTQRLDLYVGVGSSPTTGVITFNFSSTSQSACMWTVDQLNHTKITGSGGADAIVQNATNSLLGSTNVSINLSVSLNSFANNANATYGVISGWNLASITKGGNFTESANKTNGTLHSAIESQFANNPQTTVNWTTSNGNNGSTYLMGIAVELAALLNNSDLVYSQI